MAWKNCLEIGRTMLKSLKQMNLPHFTTIMNEVSFLVSATNLTIIIPRLADEEYFSQLSSPRAFFFSSIQPSSS